MNILHICSYFHTSKVHCNLFEALSSKVKAQYVYIPFNATYCKKRNTIKNDSIYLYESPCLKPWMKISLIIKVVVSYFYFMKGSDGQNFKNFDVIHSHSFFGDGLLGLLLSKRLKAQHVVTVRNTDLNMYLKYFYHLKYIARFIAKRSHIIFLSQKSFERFKSHLGSDFNYTIQANGIDEFWIRNQLDTKKAPSVEFTKLLSVGYFDQNKNFGNALKASSILKEKMNVKHTFVGGSKKDFIRIYGSDFDFSYVDFKGEISDKHLLLKEFREADIMVLPSYSESFGLVYIEAMSQQCGVVCSSGEGIDGIFSKNTAFISYCNPSSYVSIANAILEIDMRAGIKKSILNLEGFSWTQAALNLQKIYLNCNK